MKRLKNILPYMVKPENLERFKVTNDFSVNVDEELINLMLPKDKKLEEFNGKWDKESPVVHSMGQLLSLVSEYHNTINKYFILKAVNYNIKEDDTIVISFIWEKTTKEIPHGVYDLITEHDESEITLQLLVEDDKTLQISYNIV